MTSSRPARWRPACELVCVTLPVIAPLSPAGAQAVLGLEARTQASSNPLLLPGSKLGAVMAEISAKPEWKIEDTTGDTLDFAGVITGRRYSRLYDSFLLGSGSATGTLRDSERLTIKGSGTFTRDITGDTMTTTVDALVEPQSIRNTVRGEASVIWHPNVRTTITPALEAERSTFERSALLRGTREAKAQLAYQRLMTKHLWVGVRPVAAISRTQGQPALKLFALYGTLDQTLSSWKMSLNVGVEHIGSARNGIAIGIDRQSATLPTAALDVCHTGETVTACATASLGSEVSALFGFQRRKAAGARLTRRLDERRTVTADITYQRISAPAGAIVRQRDSDALSARLAADWRLSQSATASGEIGYARRTDAFGETPHALYAGLSLRWQPRVR